MKQDYSWLTEAIDRDWPAWKAGWEAEQRLNRVTRMHYTSMMAYEEYAIELLIQTEKIYQGVDRSEMKKAFIDYIMHTQYPEVCPFFMGLVMMAGLKMLDECPDYS